MKPGRREALILGAAGLAAAAAGFLLGPILLQSTNGGGPGEGTAGGDIALHSATMVDLAGQPRGLGEWRGRILVCNFWATWCAPCREEIPLLMAAKAKYASAGVEIVGIAIDNQANVRDFTTSFKISYPILLAEADGLELMRKLGNSVGGLPYTVVADRQGKVVHRKLGAFRQADLNAILGPLARN
ncbi:MAG: TlpA disulfide reductase family protein [Pseudomonadota bacterium]